MIYQEALAYLYSFADFERTGQFARDPADNLTRMSALMHLLGDPQLTYTTTHIAGTKGKGSTAALISSALVSSGVRTGLYTQPDLHTFRERIQIDGNPISEELLVVLVIELQGAIAMLSPDIAAQLITYELGTALAFMAFARESVSHAVIEVGLGGRLDATNILQPLVGIITSISLDHMAILGDTVAQIAAEKAGIIKPGMILINSVQDAEAFAVIQQKCEQQSVLMVTIGPVGGEADYRYSTIPTVPVARAADLQLHQWSLITPDGVLPMTVGLYGQHQRQNAATAIAALRVLQRQGIAVTEDGIRNGFVSVRWPARLDIVGDRPWLIVDGAHNADSLAMLLRSLNETFVYAKIWLVFGTMRDKDIAGMAQVVQIYTSQIGAMIAVQGNSPRARTTDEIRSAFSASVPVHTSDSLYDALMIAKQYATPDDLICVTGSIALAGEALRLIQQHFPSVSTAHIIVAGDDHGTE